MAIDTQCPHCGKRYKVKDEYGGKTIRCPNPECRKSFAVAAAPVAKPSPTASPANKPEAVARPKTAAEASETPASPPVRAGSHSGESSRPASPTGGAKMGIPERPGGKPAPRRVQIDAEAVAMKAFADDPPPKAEVPVETRTITMVCVVCDHQWTESWDKQGKNVICPECRHRQRVPLQKAAEKADWRNPNANRPSLARSDEPVPDNVMASFATNVSVESLEQAGVIEDDLEPRPRWHYVAAVVLPLALVGLLVYAGVSFRNATRQQQQDDYMAMARTQFLEQAEPQLPAAEKPLFRAVMFLQCAEHALRRSPAKAESLKEAVTQFLQSRQELASSGKSPVRDVLFIELALAQIELGGNESQIQEGTRLRWMPPRAATARIVVNEIERNVQQELLQTLTQMRDKDKPVDFEARLFAVRLLTRELCQRGQPEVMPGIVTQAFFPAEQAEGLAQCALETLRVTGDQPRAKATAETLKSQLSSASSPALPPQLAASSQALWLVIDPPITSPRLISEAPKSGPVPDPARLAQVAVHMLKSQPDQALELAQRPGKATAQCQALALIAEWADNPKAALTAACELAQKERSRKSGTASFGFTLYRLVRVAAQAGLHEQARELAEAIADEELRQWARAEGCRQRLRREPADATIELSACDIPSDPRHLKPSHAWCCTAIARHQARLSGQSIPPQRFADWGGGLLQGFGLAGTALGLQDRIAR